MKTPGKLLATGIIVGLLALFIGAMYLLDRDEEAGSGEKIALAQLPPAVKTTIDRESQGGSVKETEKITEDGKTVYSAEIVVNGEEREVIIAEDGSVNKRSKKEDDD